ncbi:MAG: insulinase family protein [Treponema sp.]|jgi:Zn-dependent M16 (insulinase) family peptidase|nr:insulinase family protein [Treponema sp.]
MKTTLKTGQILESGFEILDIVDLEELKAGGIWARHRSGAEVFHILNDDRENLFAFAFVTVPGDSSGAAHILEHSVLCGSQAYPLKDAFLVLAQGSLQTFLNAWTFPDKTLYPASSVNEQDYFNLMSVYGDAVFRPLLSEWAFMQEGHRFIFSSGEETDHAGTAASAPAGLALTGVVYNEMKGAYSSPDTYAGLWSVKSVLPDTPYAFESGGDPEHIPDLSWEALREFHRSRYAPANCRIFLAGNIPTEKQLSFLDRTFLSRLEPGKAAPPVPRAKPWQAPRVLHVPCPAGGDQKSTVFLSWLCGDSAGAAETTALSALSETLLGHDGSPLTRALIESCLGEDLAPVTGLEGELRERIFAVGLRGVAAGAADQVEALIMGELERLFREGIPKEEIDAALLSMEFSNREIRRSHGPYSLVWLRRSLRGWLHGAKPWESLLFVPNFRELKRRLAADSRYFESLIKKYFLDNRHRALVSVDPEPGYQEKKDAELAARLAEKERALSSGEKRAIMEKAAELERIQEEGDSPEALALIPHLSRKDLSPEIDPVPRTLLDGEGFPLLAHDLFTNGITYADFVLPLDILDPEDYPWLPLLSEIIVSLGLPGMDYGQVSSLLARTTGAFYSMVHTSSMIPGTGRTLASSAGTLDLFGRDWLIFRLKALDEKLGPALDLARRIIVEADFSDLRRIRDMVTEIKNHIDSSLAPGGQNYASSRSGSRASRSRAVSDIWNGLGLFDFIHTIAEYDTAQISRKLAALRDRLVQGGLAAGLTASGETLGAASKAVGDRFRSFGPPQPRNPASEGAEPFLALLKGGMLAPILNRPAETENVKAEVYASSSLQVGFAALSLPAAPYTSPEHAAELVLAHRLSTGALWENIRMKGGAYGVFAQPDGIERVFSLSTYRDPNPLRSLGAFGAVLGEAAEEWADEESLVKAITGSYAHETRPRTPEEQGAAGFYRFLCGLEDRRRAERLRSLIAVSAGDLRAAAARLAPAAAAGGCPVVVAGNAAAEQAAAKLGVPVKKLPV